MMMTTNGGETEFSGLKQCLFLILSIYRLGECFFFTTGKKKWESRVQLRENAGTWWHFKTENGSGNRVKGVGAKLTPGMAGCALFIMLLLSGQPFRHSNLFIGCDIIPVPSLSCTCGAITPDTNTVAPSFISLCSNIKNLYNIMCFKNRIEGFNRLNYDLILSSD